MLYPLLSEYIDAILSPEDNFELLKHLRPVLDNNGRPIMSSGNFAVVFKMEDTKGRQYALKCFLKDQVERSKSYIHISNRLNDVSSPYFVNVNYYERELFVDSSNSDQQEFPVLLMDWVEGVTLNEYIRQNIDSNIKIKYLAYSFGEMASWLLKQDFAHGDIKPDNILVKQDGSIILVDYDGMYVPEMGHRGGVEIGSPGFRHPSRTVSDFGPRMDDFSLIVILLSLKIIANNPELWTDRCGADKLLFAEEDFGNLLNNDIVSRICPSEDGEVNRLFSLLLFALSQKTLVGIDEKELRIKNPIDAVVKQYKKENLGWVVLASNGYSEDKKCLLYGKHVTSDSVTIYPGTEFIADEAFAQNKAVTKITLPNGLLSVGDSAFSGCLSLQEITIPGTLLDMGGHIFDACRSLNTIESPYFNPENQCLSVHGKLVAVVSTDGIDELIIPKDVFDTEIYAFARCRHINSLRLNKVIPENIRFSCMGASIKRFIHEDASPDGHCLVVDNELKAFVADAPIDYRIPEYVCKIGDGAFFLNRYIRSITLPPSVTSIGNDSFGECPNLESVSFSSHLKRIGSNCFFNCEALKTIHIPNSVTEIGESAFEGCTGLTSIEIPSSVVYIGFRAFAYCSSLNEVVLPVSLKTINSHSFSGCKSLRRITIPDTVELIDYGAFADCYSLEEVVLSKRLFEIHDDAFRSCNHLSKVVFKSSKVDVHSDAFSYAFNYTSLVTIKVPQGAADYYRNLHAFKGRNVSFEEYKPNSN